MPRLTNAERLAIALADACTDPRRWWLEVSLHELAAATGLEAKAIDRCLRFKWSDWKERLARKVSNLRSASYVRRGKPSACVQIVRKQFETD
ncbi:MAG: hypothetical protein OEY28_00040 [Nitrospira sp.]|nr:hypothetical protein [Nitrospira sp.]